jgi:hypothetical protein
MAEVGPTRFRDGVMVDVDDAIEVVCDKLGDGVKLGASEARLHMAVSSGDEYSMISVQRLEDLVVPAFC